MTDALESDEVLIGRYVMGDAAAFAALYRRHEMRIWRYLERNVGNRASADELMQEVWFAVARDAERFDPASRFMSWLFAIARNRMIDSIRTTRRQVSLDTIGYEAEAVVGQLTTEPRAGPLAAVLLRDQATALAQAMGQLPQEQRDAFLLQVEGDLSVEEVAAITGSSFETTKSRLRYARVKLRELLTEQATHE
jgi:RNA polymerase sigma factor (sigma-70 family)